MSNQAHASDDGARLPVTVFSSLTRMMSHRWVAWGVLGLSTVILVVLGLILSPGTLLNITREHGPVENATVAGYALVAILMLIRLPKRLPVATIGAMLSILGLAAVRELDLHKAFYQYSFFKIRFYFTPDYSPVVRLTCFLILLLTLTAAIGLMVRYGPTVIRHFSRGRAYAHTLVAMIVVGVVAKIADRFMDVASSWTGHVFRARTAAMLAVIEEPFELLIPAFILLAILQALAPAPPEHAVETVA